MKLDSKRWVPEPEIGTRILCIYFKKQREIPIN
jgi:hypothetical protein